MKRCALAFAALLAACGDGRTAEPNGAPPSAEPDAPKTPDRGSSPSTDQASTSSEAARIAAETSAACTAIGDFYWEIGDANGVIASGSAGGRSVTGSSVIALASASKLLWGAYVVERMKSNVAAIDIEAMTMRSGYSAFKSCEGSVTVTGCFKKDTNGELVAKDAGFFTYGGGHFQKYAVDLGLGLKTNAALASEMTRTLGADLEISFDTPQLAGGVSMAPSAYGRFLRKILDGSLAIREHLGERAVCTLPSACPQAHESPVPEDWHYSYGHWIEDDAANGDGSFSSPGLYGFYPWIDKDKARYGIVARRATTGLFGPSAGTAYWKSVLCGRAIRAAFLGR